MVDLSTTYLGLELAHPVMASASPVTSTIDSLVQLADAGAAAVVLPSLFEEQVEHDIVLFGGDEHALDPMRSAEAESGYLPQVGPETNMVDDYAHLLAHAKAELTIPVIASLNGTSDGGWVHYAQRLEAAGADALELNVYYVAADVDATALEVEDRYLRLVEHVRNEVEIPLAVKIGPFFSSPGNMARRLASAGADGLVLFNRFYQPDIDLDTLDVTPGLVLSTPGEMRLVLRWMAILRGRVDASLAATTGVHDGESVVKLILAGADVTMMASALLRHGPGHVATVLAEARAWFEDRGYESVEQAKGSVSQRNVPDPSAFERSNYMRVLQSYQL